MARKEMITVDDLICELQQLSVNGHGKKYVGFPEGCHSSRFEKIIVEENKDDDNHPGFVWINVD